MMAKPAVEPRARCALMMPDAMPARSGGIDDMATLVVGASARPPAGADERETEEDDDERPADADDARRPGRRRAASRRASVGRRPPTRAARPPAIGARMIIGTVKASMQNAGPLGAVVAGCSGSTA